MKVGVLAYRFDYYTNLRIIVNKVTNVEYIKVHDAYSLINQAARKINSFTSRKLFDTFDLNNQFFDFNLNNVDLLHFSNGISYGKTPWVSSFETILPRLRHIVTRHQGEVVKTIKLDGFTKRALEAISNPSCQQIIAWSHCAANIERDLLGEFPQPYTEAISKKLTVLYPPQEVLVADYAQKAVNLNGPLRFLMVGAAFFRKGGKDILIAFERLKRKFKYPFELIIISSLRIENYATQETEDDVLWANNKITENHDWITYYPSLQNDLVLDVIKKSHVGLLPSYAETYGLSALELQASGCPVITTNIRALPEINNNQVGWLIDIPRNVLGEAIYTTAQNRDEISNSICSGLESVVHQIFADPSLIERKGRAAIEKIKLEHDPVKYANALAKIYNQAVQKA